MQTGPNILRVGGLVAAVALAAAGVALLPLNHWSQQLVEWIRAAGPAGLALYAITYVSAAVLMLPGSVLTMGAGFAYGPLWGTLLVSPVSVVASSLAFLLGRTVARDRAAARTAGDPQFSAIDQALAKQGIRLVILLRLSPVLPFNLLNYALGLTQVSFRNYVVGAFVGMLPGTVLYVYLGSVVTALGAPADAGAAPMARTLLYWGGLAATAAAAILITRTARRALLHHRREECPTRLPR